MTLISVILMAIAVALLSLRFAGKNRNSGHACHHHVPAKKNTAGN